MKTNNWPATPAELVEVQREIAARELPGWHFDAADLPRLRIAACFVCFGRGGGGAGSPGDRGWAGAALYVGDQCTHTSQFEGTAQAGYTAGFLALREGPLLEGAVRSLGVPCDVLLVDATGRDHPEGAGLALHLGARLGVPTVGVTNRLLVAKNDVTMAHGAAGESGTGVEMELPDRRGATMPFFVAGTVVGLWIRTRAGVRPIAAHAAWRTDPQTASALVLATARRARTPEPLRTARRVARTARDLDVGKGERRAIERLDSPTTGA